MTLNRAISAAVALGLAIPYVFLPVTITAQSRRDPARLIEARDRRENGITVTEPRVFDDAQLQQRLQELEAQLARLQVIEQTGLTRVPGFVDTRHTTCVSQTFSTSTSTIATASLYRSSMPSGFTEMLKPSVV